jgi:hypothetical protein
MCDSPARTNSRMTAYGLAGRTLVAVRVVAERKVWRLLLASFLVWFAELAFIRWLAVEVRSFAYFKKPRPCCFAFSVSEWDARWFANQHAGTGRSQCCWGCCFWFECRGEREGY